MTRLISIREAELIFNRRRNWLYRMERDGVLPKAVKLNGRTIGWEKSDIEAFIKSRKN
ncbi:AlpA family phage regulatory protein [Salmonella enterica subsp. enterica serovar Senftenberg]|nr:AlpA family phage regulatory protein [Salmonella enterica subsp. enterica serovar Senftenberg]